MSAVGVDLAACLFSENRAAVRGARRAATEFRKGLRYGIQREPLAGQVGVRAEVRGQVLADVGELPVERQQKIDEPRRLVVRLAVGEELDGPRPRDRPEREFQ